MSDATVDLPAVGKVDRRWLWVAGAGAAGILAYAWWRAGRGGSIDMIIDPATGSVGGGDQFASVGPPGGTVDTREGGSKTPTTNQEWSALVVEALGGVGYEPGYVAGVIGRYLARQPLKPDEVDTVRTAHAMVGPPPVGSYPITAAPEPEPEPDPEPDPAPKVPAAPKGLKATSISHDRVTLGWSAVSGASFYRLQRVGGPTHDVSGTSRNWTGLKASTTYSWRVRAVGPAGSGPWSGSVSVKTSKAPSSSSGSSGGTSAPAGRWVTIAPWPAQLSTLWGVAERYLGNGSRWTTIWNASENRSLRNLRGRPENIRPGDRFWVPGAK
jgi:hypothetical protein